MKTSLYLSNLLLCCLFDSTIAGQNRLPADYVDDIYHCESPWNVDITVSISCDVNSYLWVVEELVASSPPSMCGGPNFAVNPDEANELSGLLEPCLLWALTYGNLAPSASPTATVMPSKSPTSSPTRSPIDISTTPSNSSIGSNQPPVGEPGTQPTGSQPTALQPTPPSNAVDLEPLVLTFVWPSDLDPTLVMDRAELRELTSRHVLESLQAELGVTSVKRTNIILTSGVPKDRSLSETLTGNVIFHSSEMVISPVLLERLLHQAFSLNALELYQFRLQIAQDPTLRQVAHVLVGTDVVFNQATLAPTIEEPGWSTLMIAIIASVAAALVAICCFAYCLVCRKQKRPKKRKVRALALPALPTNPTATSANEDEEAQHPPDNDGDDYEQEEDAHSVGTSVYSYLNDDMSLSAAPSFLYSINEADVSKEDDAGEFEKRKQKGLLWSVMDTLNTHFNTHEDQDQESVISAGMDSVLQPQEEHIRRTPVKKQFEALWKEDDEKELSPRSLLERQATVKKSNRAAVYEDQDTSSHTRDDISSVESPLNNLLKVAQKPTRIVNRIPDEDDDDDDDDDQNNRLVLPSTLSSSNKDPLDSSVHSQNSRGSAQSVGSNRSNSSGRPRFEPTSGGSDKIESVRKKRPSQWGSDSHSVRSSRSVHSQVSTDSAKFRSLLSQADTNDAALFLNQSADSAIPATKLSYNETDQSDSTAGTIQVTSLIQSFDKAWADTTTNVYAANNNLIQSFDKAWADTTTTKYQSTDDEEVPVDKTHDTNKTTSPTKDLNLLLLRDEEKKDDSNSVDDAQERSFDGIQERLPFEENETDKSTDDQTVATCYEGTNMGSF